MSAEKLPPEDCPQPGVVATLEETLACHHRWLWKPGVGWIHEWGEDS